MRLPPAANPTATNLREQAETLAEALPPLVSEADHVANTVAQGVHGRRRTGMGESFWQFRRFREGDSPADVDWRHSARTSHLYVRETEREAAESIWIWRDGSDSMNYASDQAPCTKRDRATVLAIAIASLLVQGGENIGVLGHDATSGTGRAVLRRFTHRMIELDPNDAKASLPPRPALPRHAQIVLISDFLEPLDDIIASLRDYAALGIRGHLIQVLDPAEEDLPFTGRTEFEGMEENLQLMVGRAESLRIAYHKRLEERRGRLLDAAQKINFTFAAHRTDRAPHSALLMLYGALSGARDIRTPSRSGG